MILVVKVVCVSIGIACLIP
nr:hypothetical protein [Shewanella jiangmenensis]